MDNALHDEIQQLLADGRKISAIAHYRSSMDCGLLEAKRAVDNIELGLPVDAAPQPVWQPETLPAGLEAVLEARLPEGWSLDQIRTLDPDAELLDPAVHEVDLVVGNDDPVRLDPDVIIGFGVLCLVRARDELGWCMGQIDPEGSITCWCDYGSDLEQAIRAL